MSETKKQYAEKRLIHVTKEQEERMARAAHEKVQSYVNELNQVQARRFELGVGLLIAVATRDGIDTARTKVEDVRRCAEAMVDADSRQKWEGLKSLFSELNVPAPQPPLEWAAKNAGVTLFDPLPERPEGLIAEPTPEELIKVVSH